MMGSRGLKGGDEMDFLTKARRWYHHKPGCVPKIKRKFWKRQRLEIKAEIRGQCHGRL